MKEQFIIYTLNIMLQNNSNITDLNNVEKLTKYV